MNKNKYASVILETIGEGSASFDEITKACGHIKTDNIRKSIHTLLKNEEIEINGYNKESKGFAFKNILLRKVNKGYKNPVYVKRLLDNPMKGNNYFEIQKIFKNRIEEINQNYYNEIKVLNEIMDKMPLSEAIKKGYIKSYEIAIQIPIQNKPESDWIKETFSDVLKKYPDAKILYLNDNFKSEIANVGTYKSNKKPYFGTIKLEHKGRGGKHDFIDSYKSYLSHLPIDPWEEQLLFKHFVIGALKEKEEDKNDTLWDLASDLTETNLISFVEKLRVIEYIKEYENDKIQHWVSF